MAGPLVRVKTKSAAISLDVDRTLNMGKGQVLRFLVPDPTQINKMRTLLVLSKGFNRITPKEETKKDGREVIIKVADLNGAVGSIIREKDLHVELDSELYSVDEVPKVAPNVAQVYQVTCKTRTLRNKYFDNIK
jgi:hypothetical protein